MATAPATKRLPNIKGWVYDNEDSYCRVEDEESREMVTDAYDPAKTYKKGETSIQDNKLYRAKADITTAEIWTPNHWEETSLETIRAEMAAEISKANSDISALNANKLGKREWNVANISNWNTANLPGWYYSSAGATGEPVSAFCAGIVLLFDYNYAYPVQIVFTFNANLIFIRTKNGIGEWNDWRKI